MGEFAEQANEIAIAIDEINRNNEMPLDVLSEVTTKIASEEVNCYPGLLDGKCYRGAFFYSLDTKKYISKRGIKLSLNTVLIKMVQHIIGSCKEQTKYAILITDSWNDSIYSPWRSTFNNIMKNVHIEVYLMTSGGCSKIKI